MTNTITRKFCSRPVRLLVLLAFMQVWVFSACKQKEAASKPAQAVNLKSKKAVSCCKSNIPPRFGMPGVQPGKVRTNK